MFSGDDEEWSDSEKTPSVSSGLEGAGSGVSSPAAAQPGDEELVALPPRLNSLVGFAIDDIRLRLALSDDATKRTTNIGENCEVRFSFFLIL